MVHRVDPTLPRSTITLVSGGATDVGKVRKVNEDSYLVAPGIVAVADGMGGHRAGDVASRMTIDACAELVTGEPLPIAAVEQLVSKANALVRAHAVEQDSMGMGSTLVGAVLVDNAGEDSLVVFNVGDSRCYATIDDGPLVQLTIDHSVVQEMVDSGEISAEEARSHAHRNVVTRAIGIEDFVAADFVVAPTGDRVRLFFCSDGVSGELSDAEIHRLLLEPGTPEEIASSVIDAVLQGSAKDNATAVVLDVIRTVSDLVDDQGASADDATGPRPRRIAEEQQISIQTTPRAVEPLVSKVASRRVIDEVPI